MAELIFISAAFPVFIFYTLDRQKKTKEDSNKKTEQLKIFGILYTVLLSRFFYIFMLPRVGCNARLESLGH